MKLSKLELNENEPMTEITPILKEFDKNKDKQLDFLEYIPHFYDEEHVASKCTVKQEDDYSNTDMNKCSTIKECLNPNSNKPDNQMC